MRAFEPVVLIPEPLAYVVKLKPILQPDLIESPKWKKFFTLYSLPDFKFGALREFDELIAQKRKLTQCLIKTLGFQFPFMPKVLMDLQDEYHLIGEKSFDYVAAFILYSITSWYCYFELTNDETYTILVLDSLLLASMMGIRDLSLSIFYFVANRVLSRSSFVVNEHILELLQRFYDENPSMPAEATTLLTHAIPRTQGMKQLQTDLLSFVARLARDREELFSRETADLIVNMIFSRAVEQTNESLQCFAFVLKLASRNQHKGLFVELSKYVLKLIEDGEEPQKWPLEKEEEAFSFKTEIGKEAIYCFLDNEEDVTIDLETSPSFPTPVNYLDKCSPSIIGKIGLVILSLTYEANYLLTFIEALFQDIESRKNSPYIGSFYCYLVYICRNIVSKNQTYKLGKMLYKTSLFDPRITVYDNVENFQLVSALRNSAIDVILSEEEEVFTSFVEYFLKYPVIFSEILRRIGERVGPFEKLLERTADARGFKEMIVYYRALRRDNSDSQKYVNLVWNSMLTMFHSALQREQIMEKLMSNQNFMYAFAVLLFDTSTQTYVFSEFEAFLKLENVSKDTLTGTLAYALAACFPAVNDLRSTNLIIRIIHLLAQIEPSDDSVVIQLRDANDILLKMFKTFELTENTNHIFLSYLESLRKKPIESLTTMDTGIILGAMKCMYNEKPTQEIYDSLLKLFTGTCVSDELPKFEIQNGLIVLVMFHVFLKSEYFPDLLAYFHELCTFSRTNCVLFHRYEVDLFILNALDEIISGNCQSSDLVDVLLKIFRLIGLVESSSSVVKKFMSLLAPRNRRLSSFCPQLIDLLVEFVMNDYWKLEISKNVANGVLLDEEQAENPNLSSGFSISLWVFPHESDSSAEILRVLNNNASLSISFESGKVCLSQVSGNVEQQLRVELEMSAWNLVVFTITPVDGKLLTIASNNVERTETIEMSYHDYGAGKLRISVGSNGSGIVEVSRILITQGLSHSLETDLYYNSPFHLDYAVFQGASPFFKFDPSSEVQTSRCNSSSFSYYLAVFWKFDLIVPIFSLCGLPLPDGRLMESLPGQALLILSKSLCFSIFEKGISRGNVAAVAHLISLLDQSVLNYHYYLRWFSVFQSVLHREIKMDLFKWILVNPNIWMKLKVSERERILQHWTYTAFPCFAPTCATVRGFSDVLMFNFAKMRQRVVDEAWERESRDCVNSILLLVSKFHFSSLDFYALSLEILKSKSPLDTENLVKLFCTMFQRDPQKLKDLDIRAEDMNVLHRLFAFEIDALRKCLIDMIIGVHRQGILPPELLCEHLEVLMVTVKTPNFSVSFVEHVLNLVNMGNPELIGLCSWFGCVGTDEIKSCVCNFFIKEISRDIDPNCNQFWYFWFFMNIFVQNRSSDERNALLGLALQLTRTDWGVLLNWLEILGSFMKVDSEKMMGWLIKQMRMLVMGNQGICAENITDFVAEAVNFLFFRPIGAPNESLMTIFKEFGDVTLTDWKPLPDRCSSQSLITREIYNDLSTYHYERASHKMFGVRLDADGKWVDIELAKDVLSTIVNHKMTQFEEVSKLLFFLISKADPEYPQMAIELFPKHEFKVDLKKQGVEQFLTCLKAPIQMNSEKLSETIRVHAQELLSTTMKLFTSTEDEMRTIRSELSRKADQLQEEPRYVEEAWLQLKASITLIGGPWYNQSSSRHITPVLLNTVCYSFCCPLVRNQVKKGMKSMTNRSRMRTCDSTECELITTNSITPYLLKMVKEEESMELFMREKNNIGVTIQLREIQYVFLRTKFHLNSALELFLDTGKSYFLNFTEQTRTSILDKLNSVIPKAIQSQNPSATMKSKWIRGYVSNFEYLMHLNITSGRTFNDITKYPVMPWILIDYHSSSLDLTNEASYRDLTKPFGALNPDKFAKMQQELKLMKRNPKSFFTSSIMSPSNVCYYLRKLEPFAQRTEEATFTSISEKFELDCREDSTQSMELPPEFFYLPEFLSDVTLPPWANDSLEFVYLHRKALESDYVSKNIHKWIDLIWGCSQKTGINLYPTHLYQKKPTDDDMSQFLRREIESQGEMPMKLFNDSHPPRKPETIEPANAHAVNVTLELDEEIRFGSCFETTHDTAKFCLILSSGVIETITLSVKSGCNFWKEPQKRTCPEFEKALSQSKVSFADGGAVAMALTNDDAFVIDKQSGNTCHRNLTPKTILRGCASDSFFAIASTDSKSHVFSSSLGYNVKFKIRSRYSDKIEASCISDTFKVYVWASRDGILTISSLEDGSPMNTITLGGVPVRITITPSWGFIVVELVVHDSGWTSHLLKVFTINGVLVRTAQIDSPVTRWCVWASNKGFDFIAYMTEGAPKIVYIAEVFYMASRNVTTNMPCENLVGFGYLPPLKVLYSITSRGVLTVQPCDYDKNCR